VTDPGAVTDPTCTTVGVIASTAHARVPGEIRGLFVRERTSLISFLR